VTRTSLAVDADDFSAGAAGATEAMTAAIAAVTRIVRPFMFPSSVDGSQILAPGQARLKT
jgi:hypothetical protein